MDLGIGGRTALVAGASSGIGEAIALALAREGTRLALCARDTERLQAVANQAKRAGADAARGFYLDLNDPDSIESALENIHAAFGDADIAVLNGGGPKPGRFTDKTVDDWDAAYRLLLRSMLVLLDGLVPPMRARKWGRIVALTSTSVKQPIDTLVLSNAFRTGLVAALKTLATEIAADGVTVNCIATGRIETDRLRELYGNDESKLREAGREVPIGRIATPQEFAPMAVFLCGEPARYVTGQTISVDGGLVRGLFG
ncbi:MAG: SDR family oxidoreductase [Candidatus Eremiobacteraeota bacterium]|nr:SDR family oxidoreductase [Candidatus Eremiobacteraeota bacterium]